MTHSADDLTHPDRVSSLPSAITVQRSRWPISIVWLIPIIAALVGGWLAINTFLNQGSTITITFHSAEGLEAGRTKIKYRDVDIGTVRSISIAPDASNGVIVTAELLKQAEEFLAEDTEFWVVKPRLSGSGLSGISTLLSGSYIGVDIGKSEKTQKHFTGLEVPPILTSGLPGRRFKLKVSDLGSIDYGTPIYFRRIPVGEVIAYKLADDGKSVSVNIFIKEPYDQYVTREARFWSVSGLDVSLGATGIKVSAESVTSILLGGITFSEPPHATSSTPVKEGRTFTLFENSVEAFKQQDTDSKIYRVVFRESVHGLSVGAPVEFRGIPIGEVIHIGVHMDKTEREITIPVTVRLYPGRLVERSDTPSSEEIPDEQYEKVLSVLVDNGMRAQLRTGSLLTGQLYITLDFFPSAKKVHMTFDTTPFEIPAIPGGFQELQDSVTSIVSKLDKLPIEQIGTDLRQTIQTLNTTIQNASTLIKRLDSEVTPQIAQTMESAQKTLEQSSKLLSQDAPMQQELREALQEVSRAARSVRALTDYLDRHPEALIRGRTPEKGHEK